MNPKKGGTPRYQKELRQRLKLWYDRMGLREWRAEIGFCKDEDSDGAAATCSITEVYLTAHIILFPSVARYWKDRRWDLIDEVLVHELSHLLTEPLYRIALDAVTNTSKKFLEDVRERQTQRIAQVVLKRFSE